MARRAQHESQPQSGRGLSLGGELKVRGPFSRAGSFEEGGGSEATPGPFFPSRGRLGYSFFRLFAFLSANVVWIPAEGRGEEIGRGPLFVLQGHFRVDSERPAGRDIRGQQ